MSVQFGEQDAFAIEADFTGRSGKWLYGHLCFWLDGRRVGDFEDTSDLASSARWGRTFLGASARRTRPGFDPVPAGAVFDALYGRYVKGVADSVPKVDAGFWDREPYLLDEIGESALRDKWGIVVVRRGDGFDRVIVCSFTQGALTETALEKGTCDRVVEAYCSWVEGLAVR